MSDRLDEFGDAAVVLVTFTRPRNLPGFRRRLGLRYPVLADERRDVYRAYGLGRASWWRVWGPATLTAYTRLLRRGRRLERPSQDTRSEVTSSSDPTAAWHTRIGSSGPTTAPAWTR